MELYIANEGYRVMISTDGNIQLLGGFLNSKSLSYDKWYIDIGYDIQLEHSEDAASEEVTTPSQPIQHKLTAELSLSVGEDAMLPVGDLVSYMTMEAMDLDYGFTKDVVTGFHVIIKNYTYNSLESELPGCFQNLLAMATECYGNAGTFPHSFTAFSDENAGFTHLDLHFGLMEDNYSISADAIIYAIDTVFTCNSLAY